MKPNISLSILYIIAHVQNNDNLIGREEYITGCLVLSVSILYTLTK